MQNECSKGNDNYYFLCRKKASEHNDALSSRLGAASRLNISESALRNYEVDTANVPQDIVCAMADLYGILSSTAISPQRWFRARNLL